MTTAYAETFNAETLLALGIPDGDSPVRKSSPVIEISQTGEMAPLRLSTRARSLGFLMLHETGDARKASVP